MSEVGRSEISGKWSGTRLVVRGERAESCDYGFGLW